MAEGPLFSSRLRPRAKQAGRLPGDHALLVRRDGIAGERRPIRADPAFASDRGGVSLGIELEATPSHAFADSGTDLGGARSDRAGEDDRLRSVQSGEIG